MNNEGAMLNWKEDVLFIWFAFFLHCILLEWFVFLIRVCNLLFCCLLFWFWFTWLIWFEIEFLLLQCTKEIKHLIFICGTIFCLYTECTFWFVWNKTKIVKLFFVDYFYLQVHARWLACKIGCLCVSLCLWCLCNVLWVFVWFGCLFYYTQSLLMAILFCLLQLSILQLSAFFCFL